MAITYYAPTFIDESMTHPDKLPTGKRSGMVFTRAKVGVYELREVVEAQGSVTVVTAKPVKRPR